MIKKKILSLTLSFFLAAFPIMQCSQSTACYAGVKTGGQSRSILCGDNGGNKKTETLSDTNPEGEWQPNPPERFSYPFPEIDTSINYGFITEPDSDTDLSDVIYGYITEDADETEINQEISDCPEQTDNKQETGNDSDQEGSKQDNETDSEQQDSVTAHPPVQEIPSTEKEPKPDSSAEQPSNPEISTETYAILNASAEKITANANGILSEYSIYIDTEGTGGFRAQTEANNWLKIGEKSSKQNASNFISFSETGRLYIFVEPNKSLSPRTEMITVTHETGTEQMQIMVKQEALHATLEISTCQKTADRNGLFYNNAVTVETNATGSYSVKINDECDWLGISATNTTDMNITLSEMEFHKDGVFYLVAKRNTGASRTASVTVTHNYGNIEKTILVTQLGNEDDCLKIDRSTSYFDSPEPASSTAFQVTAPDDCQWTASSSKNWIRVSDSESTGKHASIECTGSGKFYIQVLKNSSYEERNGYVTVSAPGMESIQVYVSQEKNGYDPASLLQELHVHAEKKTFRRNSTTKIKIEFPEGLYQSDIANITFSSSKTKVAKVTKSGTIRGIREGKAVISVHITLETGDSKLFRLKVTVGKRKIKVAKKK